MVDMGIDDLTKRIYQLAEIIYQRNGGNNGKGLPVIDRGSPEWKAWRKWRGDNGLSWRNWGKSSNRVTVISAWPPADFDEFERENLLSSRAKGKFRGE